MKTVMTKDKVAHAWAHQTQANARNAGNTFYFEGPRIYSYGSHFLISEIVKNAAGETAYLVTTDSYSVTTSGHVHSVKMAIPQTARVFHVDLSAFYSVSVDMVDSFNARKLGTLNKASRARTYQGMHLRTAQAIHLESLAFVNFFGFDSALVTPFDESGDIKQSIKDAESAQANMAEAERIKAEQKAKDAIQAWLAGENVHLHYSLDTMLRVKECMVETSRGAEFPIRHARLGLKLVQRVMTSGKDWKCNGEQLRLGHYHIDKVTAEGTVYAGCHVVKFAAIQRIEHALSQASDPCTVCGLIEGCHHSGCSQDVPVAV